MTKQNCWEFKKCGREAGGDKVEELGVCPAATFVPANGLFDGENGGRSCMFITGTLCDGQVQGAYDSKEKHCMQCDFFISLIQEFGPQIKKAAFDEYTAENEAQSTPEAQEQESLQNCWDFKECGREPGGSKADELGVCPAATYEKADGFLGGKNGGRACIFIAGTLCGGSVQGDYHEKKRKCYGCMFFVSLLKENKDMLRRIVFDNYVKQQV